MDLLCAPCLSKDEPVKEKAITVVEGLAVCPDHAALVLPSRRVQATVSRIEARAPRVEL